jgi:hypothetical protein
MALCGVELGAMGFFPAGFILIEILKNPWDWQEGIFVAGLFACLGLIGVRILLCTGHLARVKAGAAAKSLRDFRALRLTGMLLLSSSFIISFELDLIGLVVRSVILVLGTFVVVPVLIVAYLLGRLEREEFATSAHVTPTA